MPRPSQWSRDSVRAAASHQYGLLTSAQLTALGVQRSTVSRSDQLGGMFSRVLFGVHRVDGRGPLTAEQRDMAAQLYAGPESALTGSAVLGLVPAEALEDERRRGQIRGSRFARLALEEVFAGVRSLPEADVRHAFVSAGWTDLQFNPRLYLPDGRFLASPDVYHRSGVCLEVDSREHHFAVASWEATMRRHAAMTAAGLAVLHVPPSRITHDAAGVVREFAQALDVRLGWPEPHVVLRRSA